MVNRPTILPIWSCLVLKLIELSILPMIVIWPMPILGCSNLFCSSCRRLLIQTSYYLKTVGHHAKPMGRNATTETESTTRRKIHYRDSLRAVIRFSDICRVCDCCRSVHCRRQAAEHCPELRQLQQGHQLRHDQLQEAPGARARLWHVAPAGRRASTRDIFSLFCQSLGSNSYQGPCCDGRTFEGCLTPWN